MAEITYLKGYGRKAWQAKSYERLTDGSIKKDNDIMYTKTWRSRVDTVYNVDELYKSIVRNSKNGWAMFTGSFTKTLDGDSRKEFTSDEPQQFLCIDIDGGPYNTVDEFFADESLPYPLRGARCVVVYSNSYIIAKEGLAAHLFFLLAEPVASHVVKQVLTNINLLSPKILAWLTAATPDEGKTDVPLPIDPTMGQNNRIIYNAPPKLVNMQDPLPDITDRIFIREPTVAGVAGIPWECVSLNHPAFAKHRRASVAEAAMLSIRHKRGLSTTTKINGRDVDLEVAETEWKITDVQRDSSDFVRCNVNGTKRSPWFFVNGFITDKTLMHSQNPSDVPFNISKKAPSFMEWWNGTDEVAGQYVINELRAAGIIDNPHAIIDCAPEFMRRKKDV
jgi:hypothetical protein